MDHAPAARASLIFVIAVSSLLSHLREHPAHRSWRLSLMRSGSGASLGAGVCPPHPRNAHPNAGAKEPWTSPVLPQM